MLLVAGLAAAAVWRAQDMKVRHHSMEQTSAAAASLERAHSRFLMALADLSTLVSTQDQAFADSLANDAAEAEQALSLARTAILSGGGEEQAAALDGLIERISRFNDELEPSVATLLEADTEEALQSAAAGLAEAWSQIDSIQVELEGMVQEEQGGLAAERAAADRASHITLAMLIAISAATVLTGGGALVMLMMSVMRPLSSLRASVRAIASGDMEATAKVAGPEEVASLARDFNKMVSERRQAEEALRASRERYKELFENANDLIFTLDLEGRFTSLNKAAERVTGYPRDRGGPASISDIMPPESLARAREMIKWKVAGGGPTTYEAEIIAADGRRVPLEISTRLIYEDGKPVGIQGICRDISERKRAERTIRKQGEFLRSTLDALSHPFYVVDAEDYTISLANAATRPDRLPGPNTCYAMTHGLSQPCSGDEHTCPLQEVKKTKRPAIVEHVHNDDDGNPRTYEVHAYPLFDDEGDVKEMIEYNLDITERKRMEEALREQVRRDQLTGVLNHGAIVNELRELLSRSGDGSTHALAMADVDDLKAINDTYGHQVGDAVLVTVAGALSDDGATVGRYGGDEFVVVLRDADRDAAARYRYSVLDSLAHADLTDPESGAKVSVVVSIGLVVYPTEAARIEELIKLADSEMYAMKRQRPVGSTGGTSSRALGSERAARTVGELVPLLTSPGDVDEKLRLAAHRLSIGAGCDVVHFSMFPREPGGATVSQSFGVVPSDLVEAWDDDVRAEWSLPHPLRLLVERTRRPVILEDLGNDDRIPARQRDLLNAAGLRSGLVVPLLLQDTAVGLLAVGSKREGAFGPNEAQFFMAVATQVAGIARMATLVDELHSATEHLAEARIETVMLLAAAAEAHDQTTGLHLQRVRAVTEALAKELGHSEEDARALGVAAVLHDIGKVRVPDMVLGSTGRLSDEEWELMKHHTTWGERFLSQTPGFELAASIARSHHERWDGSGYPDGLAGEAIPEGATIVAVADAFDAITSGRPYRAARSAASALREVAKCSGTQFSPEVVKVLSRLHRRKMLPPTRALASEEKAAA